ncbi:glycine D-amino acid oxidase [Paucilactobacillus oligofermentans DSM 15707 = LMG 22743]|uniref:Glycine D-amino acid oxidase n=1 Tax=Paucilactobacillus oligofermentans DSM 15707 = LMG 22743 TaxID=1423778 RepID=A0A0R1RI07_9LACO|nr:FAD-dependent oxidoreductase [Paucilactobacillus oligofermentans]KRL54868.1 glycine D-amino acid oxidase [Paucilactobacillus oligofermentans DSM 15707 = LMG 22743]CUS26217.1 Putative glycine/D-amino acid oxidase [Paucilactobacillus oligofermentans DSM 15707 = LMG 22743]
MKKIAIIGGGIVGTTAAFYLSKAEDFEITLYDEQTGQATSAAAGIIAPWLSKRRNKQWYKLAHEGASLYRQLAQDAKLDSNAYSKVGVFVNRNDETALNNLFSLAQERIQTAPEMEIVEKWNQQTISSKMPYLSEWAKPGIFVGGGSRVDGKHLITQLEAASNLTVKNEKANISVVNHEVMVNEEHYDSIFIAAGAFAKELIQPFGFELQLSPQKGQLIEIEDDSINVDDSMPIVMAEGLSELIPVGNHQLLIAATHENDAGFDLNPTQPEIDGLVNNAEITMPNLEGKISTMITNIRIGTRAYTDDFSPFMGTIPGFDNVWIANGLGSSGLTTGPITGKLVADDIMSASGFDGYTKPITNYLSGIE